MKIFLLTVAVSVLSGGCTYHHYPEKKDLDRKAWSDGKADRETEVDFSLPSGARLRVRERENVGVEVKR